MKKILENSIIASKLEKTIFIKSIDDMVANQKQKTSKQIFKEHLKEYAEAYLKYEERTLYSIEAFDQNLVDISHLRYHP